MHVHICLKTEIGEKGGEKGFGVMMEDNDDYLPETERVEC